MTITEQDHLMIERFLDGDLSDRERSAFQTRIEAESELQEQLDLAEQLTASLCRSFALPEVETPVQAQEPNSGFRIPRPVGLTLAAAAAILSIGVAIKLNLPPPQRIFYTLLERTYSMYEANDFTPEWVCETDEEFATAVQDRLGQPMLVDVSDSPVELLGWAYNDDIAGYGNIILSEDSMILLVRVDGQGAFVLVDRVEDDGEPLTVTDRLGLSVFRRVLGDLVLYEVTPLGTSSVVERAFIPPAGDGDGGG